MTRRYSDISTLVLSKQKLLVFVSELMFDSSEDLWVLLLLIFRRVKRSISVIVGIKNVFQDVLSRIRIMRF